MTAEPILCAAVCAKRNGKKIHSARTEECIGPISKGFFPSLVVFLSFFCFSFFCFLEGHSTIGPVHSLIDGKRYTLCIENCKHKKKLKWHKLCKLKSVATTGQSQTKHKMSGYRPLVTRHRKVMAIVVEADQPL